MDDDLRDQVSADHEEDIDTDKTARESFETSVKKYNRYDGHGTETIDLASVLHPLTPLFDCHGFGEVSRLIYVAAPADCDVIRE